MLVGLSTEKYVAFRLPECYDGLVLVPGYLYCTIGSQLNEQYAGRNKSLMIFNSHPPKDEYAHPHKWNIFSTFVSNTHEIHQFFFGDNVFSQQ